MKRAIYRFFVWIDKLFNWFSGGDFSNTISARIGFFSGKSEGEKPFWEFMEALVNLAFFPVDGPNHCDQALTAELKRDPELDFKKGNKIAQAFVLFIITVACFPIAIILWTLKGIKNW